MDVHHVTLVYMREQCGLYKQNEEEENYKIPASLRAAW